MGDDAFGHLLLGTMKDAGIETRGIVIDPAVFTTLAFVTFDASGDRSFSFARKPGADTMLNWEEVDKSLIDEARVFHFGTLSLTDEPVHGSGRRNSQHPPKGCGDRGYVRKSPKGFFNKRISPPKSFGRASL